MSLSALICFAIVNTVGVAYARRRGGGITAIRMEDFLESLASRFGELLGTAPLLGLGISELLLPKKCPSCLKRRSFTPINLPGMAVRPHGSYY
jgi:hypothetical protein